MYYTFIIITIFSGVYCPSHDSHRSFNAHNKWTYTNSSSDICPSPFSSIAANDAGARDGSRPRICAIKQKSHEKLRCREILRHREMLRYWQILQHILRDVTLSRNIEMCLSHTNVIILHSYFQKYWILSNKRLRNTSCTSKY